MKITKMPVLISNWENERKKGFFSFLLKKSLTLISICFITEGIAILFKNRSTNLHRYIIVTSVIIVLVLISWLTREWWYKKYINSNEKQ